MAGSHRLSKSRFVAGLQCHKQLWWRVHEREAPELVPDVMGRAILDQGSRVGEVARGHVPGGVLIDLPHHDHDGRLAATRQAIDAGARAIYEAAFSADDVFAAVDILERDAGAFRVIEVKSSTRVKNEHIPDAAIQVQVLRRSGLEVSGAQVMVLNRDCVHPDLSNLFDRFDVTDQVEALLPRIPDLARGQIAMLAGPLPDVAVGPHCHTPRTCPFLARCWSVAPEHHVSTLARIDPGTAADFEAQGYATIHDLPDEVPLNAQADRQRRAVKAGHIVIDGNLARALGPFRPPLAYLDFETVNPAIPVWPGCRPFDHVPAQFSCHVETPGGALEHVGWVADGGGDPRPEIARRVVEACRGARAVVAYSMGFERKMLRHLAEAAPDQAQALHEIAGRLVDPLPVVRRHVYHPDFGGSFSLKSVLPALAPGVSYDDLEISSGSLAMIALGRLTVSGEAMPAEERGRLREALTRYCERDTLAMVRVVQRLRELAAEPGGGA